MTDESAPGRGARHSTLDKQHKVAAEKRVDPSAVVLHEAILIAGEVELERPAVSIAFSGLAAGLTIGFSMLAEGVLRANVPDAPWRELITGFGYTVGFVFVTMGKQQLYTETTLTATLPVLQARGRLPQLIGFWTIVLITNLVGTLLFAWAATAPELFDPEFREAFRAMGEEAVGQGFLTVLLKGIIAGWIMALMVWVLPATGSARILVIIGATYLIAIANLTHVIAGSVEVGHAAMLGAVSWADYGWGYILPALIGNSIGGIVMVALLNHAQVHREK